METSTILTADVLDIIFDGRNKEYGAYDLRKTYGRRLTLSITVMLSVICMFIIGFAFAGKKTFLAKDIFIPNDSVTLRVIEPEVKPIEPLPLPKKPPVAAVQVQTIRNTTIRIVPADQVDEKDKPPVNEDLADVKIGNKNVPDGDKGDLMIAPPGDPGGSVIELPRKEEEDWDKTFSKVEIESMYPGGHSAWERFIRKNLHFPDEAVEAGVEGFVVVQFIVDVEGNVSDVEAVSGPKELRAEAIRVIKKSGKWTPAVQNGRKVKSYKKQPLGFKLGDSNL